MSDELKTWHYVLELVRPKRPAPPQTTLAVTADTRRAADRIARAVARDHAADYQADRCDPTLTTIDLANLIAQEDSQP